MKKVLKYSLFALLLAATLLALVACGDHTHEYAAEWSKDASHHWHDHICDHKATDRVPVGQLASHTYDNPIVVAATCTAAGKETSTCSVCGYKKEVTIAALGHSYLKNKQDYVVEDDVLYLCTYCDTCDVPVKEAVEGAIIVTPDTAQAALDNAADGATIYFTAGDYGTLRLRTLKEKSVMTPKTSWAGGSGKIYVRTFTDLTLIAAADATFDSIASEASTHTVTVNIHSLYPTDNFIAGIAVKNLTLKGFTFTGNAANAVAFTGNVSVDGLTLDGCKMTDAAKDSRLLFVGNAGNLVGDADAVALAGVMKSITVKNCVVDGAHQIMELRGTENVTVENNTFKNVAMQTILLAVDGTNYTGAIVVKGNTADAIAERFVRVSGVAEGATVTITNNTVTNYTGADTDIVKVSSANGATVTVEGNTFPEGTTVTVPTPDAE